jgi:hypothetical protein
VIAMFGAIGILFVLPWLDTSKVRSMRYRPFARSIFVVFVFACVGLGFCGANDPDKLVFKTQADQLALTYNNTNGQPQRESLRRLRCRQVAKLDSLPPTAGAAIEIQSDRLQVAVALPDPGRVLLPVLPGSPAAARRHREAEAQAGLDRGQRPQETRLGARRRCGC